jgi:dolichol-phosphate mannosyltransferase
MRASDRKAQSPILLTVIVPVYNEEDCLEAIHQRLGAVLKDIGGQYEILFVNDGSRDRSLEILRRLAATDPHVGFLSFARNFGHEAGLSCGLANAKGQAVVLIDCDLQDPPEMIPAMLDLWRKGYDIVHAQRRRREGENVVTRLTSYFFYRIFRKLSGVNVPIDTGDFRLIDRAVVEAFLQLRERNRYVRGMISWTGFPAIAIQYDRAARLAGATKYNVIKRFNLAVDAICGVSTIPLRIMTFAGTVVTLISFVLGIWIVSQKLLFQLHIPGYALLTSGTFFLFGVQLLFLGIVGESVGRIFREVQGRPLYLLAETRRPSVRRMVKAKKAAA